jgi:hypothetical protein
VSLWPQRRRGAISKQKGELRRLSVSLAGSPPQANQAQAGAHVPTRRTQCNELRSRIRRAQMPLPLQNARRPRRAIHRPPQAGRT